MNPAFTESLTPIPELENSLSQEKMFWGPGCPPHIPTEKTDFFVELRQRDAATCHYRGRDGPNQSCTARLLVKPSNWRRAWIVAGRTTHDHNPGDAAHARCRYLRSAGASRPQFGGTFYQVPGVH